MKSKTKLEELPVEIIDGDRGENYPTQNEFLSSGYCLFLSTRNVPDMKFDFSECQFIDKKKDELLRSGKLKRGDIVFTTRGTVGNLAIFDDGVPYEEIRINSGMVILRCLDGIDNYFFYSYLQNPNFKKQIKNFSSGSAQPQLPIRDMKSLIFSIPEKAIQVRIGNFIHVLDNKIENLQKQNQILEQITQAIFKSWFIDFEFLNEDGKSYKSFGGEIVYNEEYGKEIPKGWEVSNIDKEFNLVMGQSPPGKSYNQIGDGIAFFQGRTDFGHRFPSVRMFCSEPSRFAKKGDTLISVRAPVGDVNLALYDCCIGRGLSAIRHKSDSLSYTYYIMLNLKPIFDNFESEGTVFGSINKTSFEQIKILAPAKNIVSLFEKIVNPIDKKIEDNAQQIQTLSKIRDSLLPKLMSGEIRV